MQDLAAPCAPEAVLRQGRCLLRFFAHAWPALPRNGNGRAFVLSCACARHPLPPRLGPGGDGIGSGRDVLFVR